MYPTEDTIAALSSPPGRAARAILRLSGPQTPQIAPHLFHNAPPISPKLPKLRKIGTVPNFQKPGTVTPFFETTPPRWLRLIGRAPLAPGISAPAQLLFFPAPRSYTGEHLLELHLPGSPALAAILLETALAHGARPAQPGEFTARAFFHARLDLSQAEAVAEIIAARSDAQLRSANRLLDGALRRRTDSLANDLAETLANLEAAIDFTDQDIETATLAATTDQLARSLDALRDLLAHASAWSDFRPAGQVVLAGPANAGKSSLTNALLGHPRAIVADLPGTTRDLLTAPLTLPQGRECLLIDTAGLGDVRDALAHAAQDRARHATGNAELVLWLIDASDRRPAHALTADLDLLRSLDLARPLLLVATKLDQAANPASRLAQLENGVRPHLISQSPQAPPPPILGVSSATGQGLESLRHHIENALDNPQTPPADALALTLRQQHTLRAAAERLAAALELARLDAGLELVALELRSALDEIGLISGALAPDDLLGRIFARFCIGK